MPQDCGRKLHLKGIWHHQNTKKAFKSAYYKSDIKKKNQSKIQLRVADLLLWWLTDKSGIYWHISLLKLIIHDTFPVCFQLLQQLLTCSHHQKCVVLEELGQHYMLFLFELWSSNCGKKNLSLSGIIWCVISAALTVTLFYEFLTWY